MTDSTEYTRLQTELNQAVQAFTEGQWKIETYKQHPIIRKNCTIRNIEHLMKDLNGAIYRYLYQFKREGDDYEPICKE